MKCKTCGGPARPGLFALECLRPEGKCAPLDVRTIPSIRELPPPRFGAYEGRWSFHAFEYEGAEKHPERVFGVDCPDAAAFSHVRPSREECFEAWKRDNAERIASEPARQTARLLVERLSKEKADAVCVAVFGSASDCAFIVRPEQWTELAWAAWEASQS